MSSITNIQGIAEPSTFSSNDHPLLSLPPVPPPTTTNEDSHVDKQPATSAPSQLHEHCGIYGNPVVNVGSANLVKHVTNRGSLSYLPKNPEKYENLDKLCSMVQPHIKNFTFFRTVSERFCDQHIEGARQGSTEGEKSFCQLFCLAIVEDRDNFKKSSHLQPPERMIAALRSTCDHYRIPAAIFGNDTLLRAVEIECSVIILSGNSKRRPRGCPVCTLEFASTSKHKVLQETAIQSTYAPNAPTDGQSSRLIDSSAVDFPGAPADIFRMDITAPSSEQRLVASEEVFVDDDELSLDLNLADGSDMLHFHDDCSNYPDLSM